MPGEVHVTKAADIKTSGGQTEGMARQNAIVDLAENICASGRHAHPNWVCIQLEVLADTHRSDDR